MLYLEGTWACSLLMIEVLYLGKAARRPAMFMGRKILRHLSSGFSPFPDERVVADDRSFFSDEKPSPL